MNPTDIHATLLEILQAVIALCEAEKIAYFLIGGGCLGIARHDHGFVPWDDDLDARLLAVSRSSHSPVRCTHFDRASDEIITRNKNRQPFYNYDIRREMLLHTRYVDEVLCHSGPIDGSGRVLIIQ